MWPFNCRHPAHSLGVQRKESRVQDTKYPKDFEIVTYHLFCSKCSKMVDISYADMIGGVEGFMSRKT